MEDINMSTNKYSLTSESVSLGHPDKIADQISDAFLDAYLQEDPESKVAVETMITHNNVIVAGEVSSRSEITGRGKSLVSKVIHDIGYTDSRLGFDSKNFHFQNLIHEQSRNINDSVLTGGAGDQGLMFGYACNETPELMPLPISLAHKLIAQQENIRQNGTIPWLGPDAKSQVTIRYSNGVPESVESIILSTQHLSGMEGSVIESAVRNLIIAPVIPESYLTAQTQYFINPSGRFEIGGPQADTGLTGRKIIVDTYGGACSHGGGAFSGKDASKVDRSAAYMARYLAKNIVASGITERCTVQLSYAIGRAEPTSVNLDFHDAGNYSENSVAQFIGETVNLQPRGIIKRLGLKRPVFKSTASGGHFGQANKLHTWESLDLVECLQNQFGSGRNEGQVTHALSQGIGKLG
jgi:S-adenosylmethionine synthetase